jgi:rubrerythrin
MKTKDIIKDLEQEAMGRDSKIGVQSRRVWMQNLGLIGASSAILWACGDSSDDDATAEEKCAELTAEQKKADAQVLAVALGLEYEAIELYTGAAGITDIWKDTSHAFGPTFLAIAGQFLNHHKAHATALEGLLAKMSDTGVTAPAKPGAEVFDPYGGATAVTSLTGLAGLQTILQVAAERETNAANTYFAKSQMTGGFNDRTLADASGGLAYDEASHAGVLNAAALAIGVTTVIASNIAPAGGTKVSPFKDVRKVT